jgi:hypothetical protein
MLFLDKLKSMKKLLISAVLYWAILSLFNYFLVWGNLGKAMLSSLCATIIFVSIFGIFRKRSKT